MKSIFQTITWDQKTVSGVFVAIQTFGDLFGFLPLLFYSSMSYTDLALLPSDMSIPQQYHQRNSITGHFVETE